MFNGTTYSSAQFVSVILSRHMSDRSVRVLRYFRHFCQPWSKIHMYYGSFTNHVDTYMLFCFIPRVSSFSTGSSGKRPPHGLMRLHLSMWHFSVACLYEWQVSLPSSPSRSVEESPFINHTKQNRSLLETSNKLISKQ